MENWYERALPLIGQSGIDKLKSARVAVIGLGGVGGAAVEALARSGVGALFLMDCDVFAPSNLNRQILCTVSNVGTSKAQAAAKRILSINPDCEVSVCEQRYEKDTAAVLDDFSPDFVVDAVDDVTAKLLIIERCREKNIPLITCLGTGNRLEADFAVGDIADTAGCGCPLARVMRKELKARGIEHAKVVYSRVQPQKTGLRTPSSIAFVPPVAGYKLAEYVVREIIK